MAKKSANTDKSPDFTIAIVDCRIEGTRPLLMQNGNMVNPLNEVVLAKRAITAKRGKNMTDDDHNKVAQLAFKGALWLGTDGLPCIIAEAIDGVIRDGGRFFNKGKGIEKYVSCLDDAPLHYRGMEGIKGVDDLLARFDEFKFQSRTVNAGVQKTSVWSTRPRFNDWWIEFTLQTILGGEIDLGHVQTALEHGGRTIGLGSWHRRYGFFKVTKFKQRT
jgi:hypothetical protein